VTSSPPPPPPRFKPPTFSPPVRPGGSGAPPGGPPPDAPPPKKGRSPFFWIALGCTGCVVLPLLFVALLGGAIGGGVFYLTREPVNAVRAQLEEIRRGDVDAAYARLSEAHRAQTSRADFAQLIERHPALRDNADASFWNRSLVNDEMKLRGTLTARSGAKEGVAYVLVRERGEWKIAGIRFDP
jgi:hypothetical protein